MQIVKARLVRMVECPKTGLSLRVEEDCKNCPSFSGQRFTYGYGVNETKEIRCLYPLEKGGYK